MGTPEAGTALPQIATRASLTEAVCLSVLQQMLEQKVARHEPATGHYHPRQLRLDLTDSGKDRYFKWHFEQTLAEAAREARAEFNTPDRLFFESVFTVDRTRAPQFKKALRDLLLRFVDQVENPEGDTLGKLLVSFGPIRAKAIRSDDSDPG
jgi:hypothetical protein